MDFGEVIGYGVAEARRSGSARSPTASTARVAHRVRRPRSSGGAGLLRRRGRRRRRGAARTAGLARVPPRLLRRVRPRSRRQQRRSRLSRAGVTGRPARDELVRRARPCSTATGAAPTPARRCGSIRTSGCGTRASPPSGIARFDPPRAADELRALFRGQWDERDAAAHDLRRRRRGRRQSAHLAVAPHPARRGRRHDLHHATADRRRSRSSGSPPRSRRRPRDAFVAEMVPKLVAYHRWLFRERRLDGSPLVTLIHPWECGLDSTPPWMHAARASAACRGGSAPRSASTWRACSARSATTRATSPRASAASDDDGLRMLALAVHLARHDFDLARMPPTTTRCSSRTSAFNAFFAAANDALPHSPGDLGDLAPVERARTRTRSSCSGTSRPRVLLPCTQ